MKHKILLVEDDPGDRELLINTMKLVSGMQVDHCSTAEEALLMFEEEEYSAVLVNLNLPMMGGVELICKLREASTEMPIIVVTGAEDPNRRKLAESAGATGFFCKPYSAADHLMVIAQVRARSAAFNRGRNMKSWKTTIGGAFTATGMALFGGPMALTSIKFEVPSGLQSVCIWAGLSMTVLGIFFSHLFAADKSELKKLQKTINPNANPPSDR